MLDEKLKNAAQPQLVTVAYDGTSGDIAVDTDHMDGDWGPLGKRKISYVKPVF